MIAVGLQISQLLKLGNLDCHICILPLFHIGGLSMTMATMHQGGESPAIRSPNTFSLSRACRKRQPAP
jgi:long-subunit acyl-CoA synthetase (AMP-forming)